MSQELLNTIKAMEESNHKFNEEIVGMCNNILASIDAIQNAYKPEKTARQRYESMVGMCMECREQTSVLDSCCGANVFVDGSLINPIGAELEVEEEETV